MRVVKAPTLLARRVDHVDHVSVLGCSVVVVVDRALVYVNEYVLGRQRTFRIFCPPSSTATATSPGPCRDPHSNQSAPVILGISREIAETSQCRTRERDGIFVGLGLLRPIPGSAQQRDWQLEHSMGGDLHAPKGTKRRKRTGRREDDERSEERDGGRTNSSRAVLHVVSIDDVHVHAHRSMDPSIRSRTNSFVHSFIRSFVHSSVRTPRRDLESCRGLLCRPEELEEEHGGRGRRDCDGGRVYFQEEHVDRGAPRIAEPRDSQPAVCPAVVPENMSVLLSFFFL